jgi:hypothetical protein
LVNRKNVDPVGDRFRERDFLAKDEQIQPNFCEELFRAIIDPALKECYAAA